MLHPFLERLRQGPILCDGAMGTQLYTRGSEALTHGRCFDELVLTEPALVQSIHHDYIAAGAQVIETNTFGANRARLAPHGLEERVVEINRRAAGLAREAREIAGQMVFVAGAVGPTGQLQMPVVGARDAGRLAGLRDLYHEQIGALIEGGVDLLIFETFSNLAELEQAVLAAREAGDLPIVAQVTFTEDGQTLAGQSPTRVARTLAEAGVEVVGCNCSVGPAGIYDAVAEMRAAVRAAGGGQDDGPPYLSAQPNAGLPTRIDQRFIYVSTPAYFADYAQRFVQLGVRLIGGCCGTTPRHIAAMRVALDELLPRETTTHPARASHHAGHTSTVSAVAERIPAARDDGDGAPTSEHAARPSTRLAAALEAGRFVVSIELDPPKGLNPAKILDGAAYLKSMGVEFINIADSPMARVRMSCIALARLLRDALDVEPIVHFTARDRNLMAIQSDLLGAHALGIHNVLALTGDPLRGGNYPNLTGVWDVDSVGLIGVLRSMNDGLGAAGATLGAQARFHIGAALNLNMQEVEIDQASEHQRRKLHHETDNETGDHADMALTETDLEMERFRRKLEAGAHYVMTQPIYDITPLERFFERFGSVNVPLILGMIPLHSSKHAEYLHNEVPGITIPDDVRARMREAGDRGREVGIVLAREVIAEARTRGLIQGCYLMPSYGRYDLVGELAAELVR